MNSCYAYNALPAAVTSFECRGICLRLVCMGNDIIVGIRRIEIPICPFWKWEHVWFSSVHAACFSDKCSIAAGKSVRTSVARI